MTKSTRRQMPRNRDEMPHADAETQATYTWSQGCVHRMSDMRHYA